MQVFTVLFKGVFLWDDWSGWDHMVHGGSNELMNPCRAIAIISLFALHTCIAWSEWSRIIDPDPGHLKEMHPKIITPFLW